MRYINIDIIIKRHYPNMKKRSHEEIIEAMQKVSHVRLDREQLNSLEGIDLLSEQVTHLYLQHNEIEFLKPLLDCCFNKLTLICLSHNSITKIEAIKQFKNLLLLDLSNNQIKQFEIEEIPKSIISINLKENPCTEIYNYRKILLEALPKLMQLDGDQLEEVENEISFKNIKGLTSNKSLSEIRTEIEFRSQKRQELTCSEHNLRIQSLDTFKKEEILIKSARQKATIKQNSIEVE